MLAARLTAPGQLALEEVARPVPGPCDVLVRVEACGICGSDRHMFRGEFPTALPVTLGHEFSGIVVATGADVAGIGVGARVSGDPNIACGCCAQCRAGRPNLCPALSAIGVTRDGGFAEYVLVPEAQAVLLPADLDPLHGAFCEPVSCCLHAIDVARIPRGGSVVILGGGVIGLIMVELALQAGAGAVILSTRQSARRALASDLGAAATLDAMGDAVSTLAELLPEGADVVMECAGVTETVEQAIRMARRGGTVVLFGVVPKDDRVLISPFELLTKELRLESAWLNPLTYGRAAGLIGGRVLSLDRLISRRIGLAEVPEEVAGDPVPGEIKLVMTP